MLIGITGRAGSGKNTVAALAQLQLGVENTAEVSFAGPLKEFVKQVFGWTDQHVYGDLKEVPDFDYYRPHARLRWYERPIGFVFRLFGKKWEPRGPLFLTPRYAMQTLGTEWGRDMFPDVWINLARRSWRYLRQQGGRHVFVTDVRFPNEAEAVEDDGGCVVLVERPGQKLLPASHSSETSLAAIHPDVTIRNDADLHSLQKKVDVLIENVQSGVI